MYVYTLSAKSFSKCIHFHLWCVIPQDLDEEALKAEPLIYCHFASGL